MKKSFFNSALFVLLGLSMTSCDASCFLGTLFIQLTGVICPDYLEECEPGLAGVFFSALFGQSDASTDGRSDSSLPQAPTSTQKVPQREPPGQIVGEPIASEPGGGGDQHQPASDQKINEKRSFQDVLTSPSFVLGPSLSWLGGDKSGSEKFPARPGFQLGAVWELPLSNRVQLEPGLLYSNRGMGYENEETSTYEPGQQPGNPYSYRYSQKKRLHYLELPVYASATVYKGLGVYAGPQVAFLMGAKQTNESNGAVSTVRGTKGLSSLDFGLAAGIRYTPPNTFFSFQAGYYHGLSNLSSESDNYGGGSYGYDAPKYVTRSARVGVMYHFPVARSNARKVITQGTSGKKSASAWFRK